MSIKREQWTYAPGYKVWLGKYKNSRNLPHWHYDCELLYVERGGLKVYCDQQFYEVDAGRSFFIDSESVHYMRALTNDTIVLMIVFDYSIIKPHVNGQTPASPLLKGDHGVPALFNGLKREIAGEGAFCEEIVSLRTALHVLNIFSEEPLVKKRGNKQTLDRFQGLLAEIEKDIEFCSLQDAANYMCMNVSYFSRFFYKTTGIHFSAYLNYIRVKRAIAMRKEASAMAITDIAMACGFNTIRNFNRIFKQVTGYSPTGLPADFELPVLVYERSGSSMDPTLNECELLESTSIM